METGFKRCLKLFGRNVGGEIKENDKKKHWQGKEFENQITVEIRLHDLFT